MKITTALRYCRLIISCMVCFFIAFFPVSESCALEQEFCAEVSSFEELCSSLEQMKSTGGTIVLTQDITVPAEESFIYNNGRYRNEVIIETAGHTIYVEGYLELWPFLTIRGNGDQNELINVRPKGELWLTSICLDAGENGVAVIQQEGAFLMYGSEESMGLPPFTWVGQIICPKTITAAAYWSYNCEELPVVIVPDGGDFTSDMLPSKVMASVNRDHQMYEEELPVIWDETTFPTERERTIVEGRFGDGYSQYEEHMPRCLVVFESDAEPFFLNAYMKSVTRWYDMVFMYGKSLMPGTVYIQSSDDGQIWSDIAGTDGYMPVETEGNESFSWILSYDQSENAQQRPRYYRMVQISDDGTMLCSEVLELSDDLIFASADIEGGRGGETSPDEGEDQLLGGSNEPVDDNGVSSSGSPDSSLDAEADTGSDSLEKLDERAEESAGYIGDENTENSPDSGKHTVSEEGVYPDTAVPDVQPQESDQADSASPDDIDSQKMIGIWVIVIVLICSLAFSVFRRKR